MLPRDFIQTMSCGNITNRAVGYQGIPKIADFWERGGIMIGADVFRKGNVAIFIYSDEMETETKNTPAGTENMRFSLHLYRKI